MTPDAKRHLAATIRALRSHLLDALDAAIERTYLLSVPLADAQLDRRATADRGRLEAHWQQPGASRADTVHRAASTWLNRLVLLRLLEAAGLSRPLLTGGWQSAVYKDFREVAPALCKDASEGYPLVLDAVFGELSLDLPSLYGPVGLVPLVPMPPATLRHLVEALDAPELTSCWDDDLTLGWVYQYWNDPAREALDTKLNGGGKLDPSEIASKTQMFTERYMVDWLLQNTLGPLWFAICAKHGWTPEVVADGTLDALEARRVAFRAARDAGAVSPTDLMPLHTDHERRWAYFLAQPLPDGAAAAARDSIRDVRLLDPAVGSGHFLVVAFDLLLALYAEEARHRGEADRPEWSVDACAARVLEHNLAGVDLDPRAVQIAAASLWLRAQKASPGVRPKGMNLVATAFGLARVRPDDPSRVRLLTELPRLTRGHMQHGGCIFTEGVVADVPVAARGLHLAQQPHQLEIVRHPHRTQRQDSSMERGTIGRRHRVHPFRPTIASDKKMQPHSARSQHQDIIKKTEDNRRSGWGRCGQRVA